LTTALSKEKKKRKKENYKKIQKALVNKSKTCSFRATKRTNLSKHVWRTNSTNNSAQIKNILIWGSSTFFRGIPSTICWT